MAAPALPRDKPRRARIHRPRSAARPMPVPALGKGLDVLELLASAADGLTMNEIADSLDRTMGEIYRIVLYLAERSYVQQDGSGRYRLTLRLFELSHRFEPTERLIAAALPLMEMLARRTEQSCHLAVLSERSVLVLASVPSPRPAGYSVRTGAIFPLHPTSSGAVIAAFLPEDRQAGLLDTLPAAEAEALRRRMQRIRRRGFEELESPMVRGVTNKSVPVFARTGIVAALTMGYIAQAGSIIQPGEALAEVRATAAQISAAMGGDLHDAAGDTA